MDGPNYVTRLESTDKTLAIRDAQVSIPIAANASVYSVIKLVLNAINANAKARGTVPLGEGATTKNITSDLPTLWPRGGTLHGFAKNVMDDVCKSAGLIWTIDKGAILLTLQSQPKGHGNPVLLNASTGLIESPGNDGKGVLNAKCLIVPDISLGKIIQLQSKFLNGFYTIIQADYHGDTHGKDWNIHLKMTAVS
jgi:hypothetical protein